MNFLIITFIYILGGHDSLNPSDKSYRKFVSNILKFNLKTTYRMYRSMNGFLKGREFYWKYICVYCSRKVGRCFGKMLVTFSIKKELCTLEAVH